jgi:hypothetical protein
LSAAICDAGTMVLEGMSVSRFGEMTGQEYPIYLVTL